MSTSIILVGNGIAAQIIRDFLRCDARHTVAGTVVDDAFVNGNTLPDLPCVGLSRVKEVFPPDRHQVIMAIGYDNLNRTRETMFRKMREQGYDIPAYIHPDAKIYNVAPIRSGCVVLPNAVIEPGVCIGENSVVWCNVTVAHHAAIADNCWLAAGAVVSGQAKVGRNTFVGVNATIVNEVEVGEYNIVGAAALISKHTKPRTVHLARSGEPLRYSSEEYIEHFGV